MEKIEKVLAGIDGLLEKISSKNEPYFNGQAVGLNYVKEIIRQQYPELAESEDERIRKEIIAFLQSMNGYCNPTQDWDLRNRWLPYLEKQKEQQPAEWSEEDKYRLEQAINALGRNGYYVLVDWLKSLPERFNL